MDWIISDEISSTIGNIVGWISAGAMIIGGALPYVPQYLQIKKTQDSEGFSLYVCLALLVANTLRIYFWFGKRFEYPLLIQSIIMNITMLMMVHLCVQVRSKHIQGRARVFTDFDIKYFWAWTDFQSYLDCMMIFAIVCAIVMFLMIDINWFVELVGFLAVFTEAMLGVPQLLKNYKNQSTLGMSVTMVIMWTCGDIFKTIYFVIRDAPAQFWICGIMQVIIDIAILAQVRWYQSSTTAKSSLIHRVD